MSRQPSNNITIRPFKPDSDADAVGVITGRIWHGGGDALMEARFGPIGSRPWSDWIAQSVLSHLKAAGTRSFVAERDGRIVGFCSYTIDEARSRGTVGYNGVAPDQQGQGIGSKMMSHVMAAIRAENMQYAAVMVGDNEAHAPARRVYEKHGFKHLMGLQFLVQKL